MGHCIGELDPQGTLDRINFIERQLALNEALKDIPLGYFRVKDLIPLMKLTGLIGMPHEPTTHDIGQLEGRVEEIRAGDIPFSPQPQT